MNVLLATSQETVSVHRHPGRPKGSRDRKPRIKKRDSGADESIDSFRAADCEEFSSSPGPIPTSHCTNLSQLADPFHGDWPYW